MTASLATVLHLHHCMGDRPPSPNTQTFLGEWEREDLRSFVVRRFKVKVLSSAARKYIIKSRSDLNTQYIQFRVVRGCRSGVYSCGYVTTLGTLAPKAALAMR